MPSRQELSSTLANTRQELQNAQTRIAALEAQLLEERPNPMDLPYRLFIEHAPAALAMLDNDMRYLLVSRRWLTDYRLSETNVVGRSHYDLFPDLPEQWKAIHQRCLAGAVEYSAVDPFPRADGSLDWVRWEIHPWRKLDGTIGGILILSEVITERKRAEEQIRKLHRTLGVLSDINQAIVRIRHLPSLFEKACAIAVEKGDFRMAWLGLFDPITGRIDPVAHAGIADTDLEKLISTLNIPLFIGALRTGERLICNDMQTDPMWLSLREEALRLGYRAMAVLPLLVAGELRGFFHLYAGATDFFDEQEMRLIVEMAVDVSFAIEVAEQDAQRQNAEAELRANEEKYRSLIESSESSIALFDEHGVLLYANQIAANTLSLTREEAVGRQMHDLFPAAVSQYQLSGIQQVIRTGEGTVREASSFVLDEERWYRTSVQPIRDASGKVTSALINAVDITRLKRAEADLRNERDTLEEKVAKRTADLQVALVRVEAILNNSPDAILLLSADLTIQQTNLSFNTLFGVVWDEYLGKPLLTLLHPDDANKMRDFPQIAAEQQRGRRMEVCAIGKDGTTFDAELTIGVIKDEGLVCIIRDITARKAQERQLRYHASIQESVSDAVIATDMQFRIQSWNRTAELIYGWSTTETLGKSVNELLQTTFVSAEEGERILHDFFERGAWQGELVQHRRDGRMIYIHASVNLFKDEMGQPIGVVAVNRDITELQQAQRAVVERETRYRLLAENISDVIAKMNPEGIRTFITPSCYMLLGYTPDELVGQPSINIVHPDDRPDTLAAIRQAVSEGKTTFSFTRRFRHKAGRDVWVEVTNNMIYDRDTGQPMEVIGVLRDISERKKAEAELREAEHRYHALFEQSHDAVFLVDLQGHLLEVNARAAEMLGYSVEELRTLSYRELSDEVPQSEALIQQLLAGESFPIYERIMRKKDGSRISVEINIEIVRDLDGNPLHIQSVVRDITERKRAEEALRVSEGRYRLLAENIADVIMTFSLDRLITYMSPSCEGLLGYLPVEVEGKSHSEFIHPEDYPQVINRTRQAVASKENFYTNQFRLRHKAGHYIWYEVRTRIVFNDDTGNVVQFISILRDITERKHADDALRESEERFRRAIIDAPFPVMIHADDGEVLHISNAWAKISGYTHADIPTMTAWVEKAYGENSQTVRPVINKVYALTEARRGGEFRIRTKAGEERIWDFISAPVTVMPDGRRMVSSMAMDITERKRTEEALQNKMAEERQFQVYLKALHEIIIELTGIDHLDTFYKRAVVLGRERLGFERLAMFLYDEQDDSAVGTYGTDIQGNLVDERGMRFTPDPHGIMRRSFDRIERFYIKEGTTLYNNAVAVGTGWNAAAVLWNGTQSLGWFVADNLLSHLPAAKPLLDVIGLYALSIGPLLAQKQTQLALKESEALYRLLAENISDLIMRSALTSECLYVSPSVQILLGYTPEELLGQQTFCLIHPDDQAIVWKAYVPALARKDLILSHQYRVKHKDGHYIWLETVGKPIFREESTEISGVITSSRDITMRRQSEEALRASEEKYRSLIETMRGGLAVFDTEFRVTFVNDRFCELLGYSREELLGLHPTNFIDAAHIPLVQSHFERHQHAESTSYEVALYHKAGHQIYVLLSGSPLFDKQGKYSGSTVVATDISIQKQAEETLRQALTKEKELGDLKTRFVSMASHEFRTPLATILALVETLTAYRTKLSEEQIEQRYNKIKAQIGHLKNIMEDVLMLSRMQAHRVEFNPVMLDLGALSCSILDEFQSRPDIKHRLEYTASEGIHEVLLDHKLMRQLLSNLIANAIKYSPKGTVIRIHLEYSDSAVILKVSDEGIGIPEADLPHLFEPFHRAANVGTISGTGLGLVITREAVELHGGTITVESQQGVGTTFLIRIPMAKEAAHEKNL